jgi:hypothetical protein
MMQPPLPVPKTTKKELVCTASFTWFNVQNDSGKKTYSCTIGKEGINDPILDTVEAQHESIGEYYAP